MCGYVKNEKWRSYFIVVVVVAVAIAALSLPPSLACYLPLYPINCLMFSLRCNKPPTSFPQIADHILNERAIWCKWRTVYANKTKQSRATTYCTTHKRPSYSHSLALGTMIGLKSPRQHIRATTTGTNICLNSSKVNL